MKKKITIIGLGYVGLPLARLFATKYNVIGFDINSSRVNEINNGIDSTLELTNDELTRVLKDSNDASRGLYCTSLENDILDSNIYIVTVPTPIDEHNKPMLAPLLKASKTIGKYLKKGDFVIYESTVYPGVTEEECAPILEEVSNLVFNEDFYLGYSPERINPGDKLHTIEKILKVTSGSNSQAALYVDNLYKSVITAGTHMAPSIKVAEAAKVIENSQRDINIAFVNELAKIFNRLNISTNDVLAAARTKWNFLPFTPGLVGGHCIGVDPYYLAQKAQAVGYHPEIILAGRRVNDSMGSYVASQVVKLMISEDIILKDSKVLILGFTFKENCPDVRNTKVIDIYNNLIDFSINATVYDPLANPDIVEYEYGIRNLINLNGDKYDAIVLAVAHNEFLEMDLNVISHENTVVYDVKGVLGTKADQTL
ncbi:UDP-N-acetyl-D-galactosamine dehydrogenase [Nonlabens arenilitoris]|uniref:UDP-N-acetyl-D-galactosamine dehydrogenase n=1 Tax=Nonlabens arenilitoris TaxID=1217969 RepID=A0A2S7UEN1_9FLAO|nr:nucleotide sugar dehydrogenase [Nonlabens arenilitoris]PQJ33060.1 UDP-N-acetyl-D-galactosamine dehydrogenase [Nonlabens arenilitoris]